MDDESNERFAAALRAIAKTARYNDKTGTADIMDEAARRIEDAELMLWALTNGWRTDTESGYANWGDQKMTQWRTWDNRSALDGGTKRYSFRSDSETPVLNDTVRDAIRKHKEESK